MPAFERFSYDPGMVEGGGVRWENSLVVGCDPKEGRRIARALNAVLQEEYRQPSKATTFDVIGDFDGKKNTIALYFGNDRVSSGAVLEEQEAERLIRMIRYELRQVRRARKRRGK